MINLPNSVASESGETEVTRVSCRPRVTRALALARRRRALMMQLRHEGLESTRVVVAEISFFCLALEFILMSLKIVYSVHINLIQFRSAILIFSSDERLEITRNIPCILLNKVWAYFEWLDADANENQIPQTLRSRKSVIFDKCPISSSSHSLYFPT